MKAASDTFEAASEQLLRKRLFRRAGAALASARFQLFGALIAAGHATATQVDELFQTAARF
jgi:hypothetical protein